MTSSVSDRCGEGLAERDCDKPIHRPQAARLGASTAGSRASNLSSSRTIRISWLPPLRFQLPSSLEEDTSHFASTMRPLLNRSPTCTTTSSSTNSRNTSHVESTMSRHPSTVSSASNQLSSTGILTSEARSWLIQNPSVLGAPERHYHFRHPRCYGRGPVRPQSRPAMPPAEFWTYASKQQMRLSHSTKSEYSNNHDTRYDSRQRQPSLCRYPLIAAPAKPVCRTRRTTVHSETAHMQTASYESMRKGDLRKIEEDSRKPLGETTLAVVNETRKRSSGKESKKRQSRTLVKLRQPEYK